jgi:7,8-dihydro-6-hydroxymethylpterin-pyrophosphokinase
MLFRDAICTRRNGPRVVDLDILLYGQEVYNNDQVLTIPHARLAEREFVLRCGAEVCFSPQEMAFVMGCFDVVDAGCKLQATL